MLRRDFLTGASTLSLLGLAGCATGAADANADPVEAAFLYGFPLYEFARTEQLRTGGGAGAAGAAMNTVAHRAQLADHTSRQVTAPNNDTIYSSAFLELSGGPVEVNAPDMDRYFSVTFMDAFTDNFAGLGTRLTKGKGGRCWVVGPTWTGSAPAGVTLFRSSTNDVWMLGRTLVDGPDDLPAARALQQKITVKQVQPGTPRAYAVACTSSEDAANFLAVVNEVMARSPGRMGHLARRDKFVATGLGAPSATPEQLAAWSAYLPKGLAKLRSKTMARDVKVNGWGYQEAGVGVASATDLLRSTIALGGLAALPEEEAMYLQCVADEVDAPLTGANRYVWRIPPAGVPAEAFWSLTMYQAEPDGRFFLTENPIRRFSIGNRTRGLVKNPDGSIDILMQRDQPSGEKAANWLPTPQGPIRLSLRAYLPKLELRQRSWRPPPVRKV